MAVNLAIKAGTLAAPYVIEYGIKGAAYLLGKHAEWNTLHTTYNTTVATTKQVAENSAAFMGETAKGIAGKAGEGLGKIIAPAVALSPKSKAAAVNTGAFVELGAKMVGQGIIENRKAHNEGDSSVKKITTLKVIGGLAMISLGFGTAPEIALGLAIKLGIDTALNYYTSPKGEATDDISDNIAPQKDIDMPAVNKTKKSKLSEDEIASLLDRSEVQQFLKAKQKNTEALEKSIKEFVMLSNDPLPASDDKDPVSSMITSVG